MTTSDPGQQTTSTNGEFGTSEYGDRLSYNEGGCCSGWRDRGWAIGYYIHILIMIFLSIYFPVKIATWVDENTSDFTWTFTTTEAPNDNESLTGIIVTLLVQCVAGAVFGLVWLKVMQMFAEFIIKGMLFMVLVLWLAVVILGVIMAPYGTAIIVLGIIGFLFNALYTYCVWSRIPFSSALLKIASSITQTFEGTICISLCIIPMNIIWYFVWVMAFYGFIVDYYIQLYTSNGEQTMSNGVLYLIYFLYCLSLYWGIQVHKNISHTTTAGVAATWFFSKEVHKPTMPAFKRTLTTSFGSVCFGSFIVAVLQATRALIRSQRNSAVCACIALCLLACIEALVRYFNMYAYVQCAIYGSDFITAAKATWGLFMAKGFEAVINDDLTGLALFCGGFLAFVVCFFVGFFLYQVFYPDETIGVAILVGFGGGILGYMLCVTILMVVRSSIVALFVCFAEDPSAMANNRPDEYNMLIGAKQELNTFATTGHTGVEDKK